MNKILSRHLSLRDSLLLQNVVRSNCVIMRFDEDIILSMLRGDFVIIFNDNCNMMIRNKICDVIRRNIVTEDDIILYEYIITKIMGNPRMLSCIDGVLIINYGSTTRTVTTKIDSRWGSSSTYKNSVFYNDIEYSSIYYVVINSQVLHISIGVNNLIQVCYGMTCITSNGKFSGYPPPTQQMIKLLGTIQQYIVDGNTL